MDQDIHFQHNIDFAAGAITHYFIVPYRCTLRDFTGIVQADPGDDETITVTHEPTVGGTSTALGVLTFGNTIAAGAIGTWVADTTTGNTVLGEGEYIVMVTSTAAAAQCNCDLELDPYARTTA